MMDALDSIICTLEVNDETETRNSSTSSTTSSNTTDIFLQTLRLSTESEPNVTRQYTLS